MRTTYIKVFKDKKKLKKMLRLRKQGWTYVSLALMFGVDFSSIYKACKIRGVFPTKKHLIGLTIPSILIVSGVKSEVKPKSFQDYLDIEKGKRFPNVQRLMGNTSYV